MRRSSINLSIILFALLLPIGLIAQEKTRYQSKTEISLRYSLQCPIYSVNTAQDLSISQDTRYRSRLSIGARYYLFRRWYIEYSPSFSQEGGGYYEQHTNTNYLKNSIFIGFSSLHSHRIVFNMYCGIEANILLNAKLINSITNEKSDVSSYFNNSNISYPIGLGFKTAIFKDYYLNLHTFLSFSSYKISNESYIQVSQIIFPAFQVGISKFLK